MSRTTNRFGVATATAALALIAITAPLGAQRSAGRAATSAGRAGTSAADDRLTGVMFGVTTVAAPGVSVGGPDFDFDFKTSFGTGVGVMVGYGFSPMWSVFGSLDVAKQNSAMPQAEGTWGLLHLELGARVNLVTANPKTIPYATASVGRRALGARITDLEWDEEHDMTLSGGMLALGGGVEHFFNPTTALDAGLTMGFGSFGHVDDDGDQFDVQANRTTSIRLRVGVTWHP